MDILYLINVLWNKKWIISILSIISMVIAFLLTANLPDRYLASAQIETGFATNEGIQISDERFNFQSASIKFNNLISIMNSGLMYNLLTYNLVLHDLDSLNFPFREINKRDLDSFLSTDDIHLARILFTKRLKEQIPLNISDENADILMTIIKILGYTYTDLRESLYIRRIPNTDYIQVMFESENRELSAYAVNVYCEELIKYYSLSKIDKSNETVEFYGNLVEKEKIEFTKKSSELRDFKQNNQYLDINTEESGSMDGIAQLRNQKIEIESEIYRLNLKLRNLIEKDIRETEEPNTNNTNKRIIELRQRIASLNDEYASNPDDNILGDSIMMLKELLGIEISKVNEDKNVNDNIKIDIGEDKKNLEFELEIQQSKLNSINKQINRIQTDINSYVSNEAELKKLEREVEVASNEYLNTLDKYNEARNKLLASATSLRLMSKAAPPASPESSQRILIIGFSGIATFMLCLSVFIIFEVLSRTVKTPKLFEEIVNINILGTLVEVNTKQLDFSKLFSDKLKTEEFHIFKHFLRKIRFEIEKTSKQVFLITSLKRKEGKSLIIFALAYVFSLINKKVLIIDTNFKNNDLTRTYGINSQGLPLLGSAHVDSTPSRFNTDSNLETNNIDRSLNFPVEVMKNIFLIGNVGNSKSPEEILYDKDFSFFVTSLKNSFDYIFLEGPALNEYSDSKELEKYVEKIITVFSANSSIRQADFETIKHLKHLDDSLLAGAILNRINYKDLKL